jgi:hypothetical protein
MIKLRKISLEYVLTQSLSMSSVALCYEVHKSRNGNILFCSFCLVPYSIDDMMFFILIKIRCPTVELCVCVCVFFFFCRIIQGCNIKESGESL